MSYPLGVWQALLAVVYVADKARLGDLEFVPTATVAEDLGIPTPSLARLLRALAAAGVVETREGARGGVRLASRPDRIAILDVVEAVDPRESLFRTDAAPAVAGETPARRQAAIRGALDDATLAFKQRLAATSIEDVCSS